VSEHTTIADRVFVEVDSFIEDLMSSILFDWNSMYIFISFIYIFISFMNTANKYITQNLFEFLLMSVDPRNDIGTQSHWLKLDALLPSTLMNIFVSTRTSAPTSQTFLILYFFCSKW